MSDKKTNIMWAAGLEPQDMEAIRSCLDDSHRLVGLSPERKPSLEDVERDRPVLVWMGEAFWRKFLSGEVPVPDGEPLRSRLESLPRILLLGEAGTADDMEKALDSGFDDVVRGTASAERIHRIVRRSLDFINERRNQDRMLREILMNRELLARKSDIFTFLQEFVVSTSAATSRSEALEEARAVIRDFLPVVAIHVVCWNSEAPSLHFCLDTPAPSEKNGSRACADAWIAFLQQVIDGLPPQGKTRTFYGGGTYGWDDEGFDGAALLPDAERTLLLPLSLRSEIRGVLAILLEPDSHLGRDQVAALDAAAAHLAPILNLVWSLGEGSELPAEKAPQAASAS